MRSDYICRGTFSLALPRIHAVQPTGGGFGDAFLTILSRIGGRDDRDN
jgi:hypothetical protein